MSRDAGSLPVRSAVDTRQVGRLSASAILLTVGAFFMAKHKLGKTNQKLYYAQLQLQAMERAQADDELLNKKAVMAAGREAVLYLLFSAYRSFLWELATVYNLELHDYDGLAELLEQARKAGAQVSEFSRLDQLEKNNKSWLAQMLQAWRLINKPDPAETGSAVQKANLNSIEIIKENETESLDTLKHWYTSLKQEVESIRQFLVEW